MTFELRPIEYGADNVLWQVEAMRQIRNACRHFMTRDPAEITPEMQGAWWAKMQLRDPNNVTWQPFLAWSKEPLGWEPIGYAIAWRGERIVQYRVVSHEAKNAWWFTGAVLERWRGFGYGRRLFQTLIDRYGTPCWLEVRLDNQPARQLYQSLGFQVVGTDVDVATMRLGRART